MFKFSLGGIILIGCSLLFTDIVKAENGHLIFNKHDQKVNSEKDSVQIKTIRGEKNEISNARKFFVNMPNRKEAGNSDFNPKELVVKVGDIVIWTNNDTRTHYVSTMKHNYPERNLTEEIEDEEEEEEEQVDDSYFSSSDIDPGDTFRHSFNKAGTYKYFCFTHPIEMQGVVIVEE
jgi:plastocyanin